MGIPRLGARLKPYSDRTRLGGPTLDSPGAAGVAIIDGPSLVHYIYYELLHASPSSARSPPGPQLDYADCVRAVLQWLRLVQSLGLKM